MPAQPNNFKTGKKTLFVTDGLDTPLTGYCMYFLRSGFPVLNTMGGHMADNRADLDDLAIPAAFYYCLCWL